MVEVFALLLPALSVERPTCLAYAGLVAVVLQVVRQVLPQETLSFLFAVFALGAAHSRILALIFKMRRQILASELLAARLRTQLDSEHANMREVVLEVSVLDVVLAALVRAAKGCRQEHFLGHFVFCCHRSEWYLLRFFTREADFNSFSVARHANQVRGASVAAPGSNRNEITDGTPGSHLLEEFFAVACVQGHEAGLQVGQ